MLGLLLLTFHNIYRSFMKILGVCPSKMTEHCKLCLKEL